MRIITTLLLVISFGTYSYAQEATPEMPRLKLSTGIAMASGKSKIDRTSPTYSMPVSFSEIEFSTKETTLEATWQWSPESFGGKSVSAGIEQQLFSLGIIRVGAGIHYFYALDRDVVWDDGILAVYGRTRKQYASGGFNAGIGNFRKSHARFYVMAGATEMYKEIELFEGSRALKGSPSLVDNTLDATAVLGGKVRWADNAGRIDSRLDVRYIRTVDTPDHKNIKHIIPPSQTIVSGAVDMRIFKKLRGGAFATWTNHDTGMVFLGRSYGLKTIVTF